MDVHKILSSSAMFHEDSGERSCIIKSVGWNGFRGVCVCWASYRRKRESGVHMRKFRCTRSSRPGWAPDRSSCSFTSSWCSFCSESWSTPGCCRLNAPRQKTPEEQHRHNKHNLVRSDLTKHTQSTEVLWLFNSTKYKLFRCMFFKDTVFLNFICQSIPYMFPSDHSNWMCLMGWRRLCVLETTRKKKFSFLLSNIPGGYRYFWQSRNNSLVTK